MVDREITIEKINKLTDLIKSLRKHDDYAMVALESWVTELRVHKKLANGWNLRMINMNHVWKDLHK